MFAFEQNPAAAPSEPGWESVVVEELGRAEVQLTKSPTASLSGIVRENGLPLADARVAFLAGPGGPAASGPREQLLEMAGQFEGGLGGRRGRGSGRTDDQGRYELKELQEGQHRLRITHQKRSMPAEVSVFLRLGANTFDVDLQTSTLRGVVRDPDGKPVAGVSVSVGPPTAAPTGPRPSVRVEGAPGVAGELAQAVEAMAPGLAGGGRNTVRTGDDGSFELRGVQPDKKLVVRATKKGFAPAATAAIEVAPGQTRDGVDLQLLTGGAIRVRSAGAAPFTAVQAIWAGEQPNDFPGAVQVLQNGTTLFEGLRPGRWQLRVMAAANQGQPPTFVEVLAGQTIEVTL
jgi:hypothetical protein